MDRAQFNRFDTRVDAAARHACSVLLAMDSFRTSNDPAERAAYRDVHDLIGDLSSLRVELDQVPVEVADVSDISSVPESLTSRRSRRDRQPRPQAG